jgi:hypothetical protein
MYELKYYLDTNAVRSFSPHLKKCREMGAFTSIWTICEMLGRVLKNPKDFDKIQKNLKEVKDSGICVATKLPMELHYDAFGIPFPNNTLGSNILGLVALMLKEYSYNSWENNFSKKEYADAREYIIGTDNGSKYFNHCLEKEYNLELLPKESIQKYEEFIKNEDKYLSKKRLIEYYAENLIKKNNNGQNIVNLLGLTYEQVTQLLCYIYDGSIDIAIRVSASYVNRKVSGRDKAKRNDDIDLMHLYYLRDDIMLVTKDGMLLEYVNAEFPGRAISNDDFKKILDSVS